MQDFASLLLWEVDIITEFSIIGLMAEASLPHGRHDDGRGKYQK